MKLNVNAMFVPNDGAGTDGCEPPNDCDPMNVTPGVDLVTGDQLLNSVAICVAPVVATHIGVEPTGDIIPEPAVAVEVTSAADAEPLNRPVNCEGFALAGSDIVSTKARSEPDVFVRLSEPLCDARSAVLLAVKL